MDKIKELSPRKKSALDILFERIFDNRNCVLLIDDPDKDTITFETFRKICNELDSGLSEEQIRDMLKASTKNGKEITFEEFEEYMKGLEK